MLDQMKKMLELKKKADMLKRELEKLEIEYNEVRGIRLKLNGAQIFNTIEIDDSWLDPKQKSRFQTELIKAVNMATRKAQKEAAVQMQKMPGFDIPGLS